MIRLDTVNRSLTLVLGGAQVTAPLQSVVSYSDQTSATYLGSSQLTNSNGTTPVTICSAPTASVVRDIDMVTVLNTDTGTQTVTIQLLDTATTYKIITVTLLVGDKLTYTHGSAWQVVNDFGNIKYTVLATTGVNSFSGGSTGLTPATATTGVVTLGGTLAVASGGTGTATPALVAGTNVTITGSWPNQTINSSNTGGTVTSVAALTLGTTGTDVSSTVANSTTTPVITFNLPTASATNRGALSAADWTTFNSKGSGSVTSVAATVPSFLSISGSPVTTAGTLAIGYSGTALPVANGGTGLTAVIYTIQVFTSSGTYTKPSNVKFVKVMVVGGGGGGGSAATNAGGFNSAATGGGGAGTSIKLIDASSVGATETITIGALGGGGTSAGNGSAGGTSSFGAHCSATGGSGGQGCPSISNAGQNTEGGVTSTGGVGSGGSFNLTGGSGGFGFSFASPNRGVGGSGGASFLCAGPEGVQSSAISAASTQYGAGGSGGAALGGQSTVAGGSGAAGIIVVEEFY